MMDKRVDFAELERKAEDMTVDQLKYAIKDAQACSLLGIDEGYYNDQISVYRIELAKKREGLR
jgi:hypothetical protein